MKENTYSSETIAKVNLMTLKIQVHEDKTLPQTMDIQAPFAMGSKEKNESIFLCKK